ncbi:threonine synthase [Chloroflexota bacterium]
MNISRICSRCHTRYAVDTLAYRCQCGGAFELEKTPVELPIGKIKDRPGSIWRYREVLPIEDDENIVTLGEGMTPLIKESLCGKDVLLKLDYLFPSGCYKDRGASVLVSKMKELGIMRAVEDSSGNAGAALAAYCARAGIGCEIYCPEDTSKEKLVQISLYGAKLNRIPGPRENTATAIREKAKDVFYASHNWNPFFLEGTKTVFYEICEQLDWNAPDSVIMPVGYGSIILGIALAGRELRAMGVIDRLPRLVAVQTEACPPVYRAFIKGETGVAPLTEAGPTLAEGIACSNPVRGRQILEAVRDSNGEVVTVSEKDIIEGMAVLARKGICVEPTSAVVVGALKKSAKVVEGETNVVILTSSGLKATDKMKLM